MSMAHERERAALTKLRAELLANVTGLRAGRLAVPESEASGDLSSYDNHPADLGSETFEREKDLGLMGNDLALLGKVEGALRRMEEGTYGRCVDCQGEIAPARLDAEPWAERCFACQKAFEQADPSRRRPVEEAVLNPPTVWKRRPDLGYDATDTWQDVASVGSSDTAQDDPPLRGKVGGRQGGTSDQAQWQSGEGGEPFAGTGEEA
jgi:YteA family regulatory protein